MRESRRCFCAETKADGKRFPVGAEVTDGIEHYHMGEETTLNAIRTFLARVAEYWENLDTLTRKMLLPIIVLLGALLISGCAGPMQFEDREPVLSNWPGPAAVPTAQPGEGPGDTVGEGLTSEFVPVEPDPIDLATTDKEFMAKVGLDSFVYEQNEPMLMTKEYTGFNGVFLLNLYKDENTFISITVLELNPDDPNSRIVMSPVGPYPYGILREDPNNESKPRWTDLHGNSLDPTLKTVSQIAIENARPFDNQNVKGIVVATAHYLSVNLLPEEAYLTHPKIVPPEHMHSFEYVRDTETYFHNPGRPGWCMMSSGYMKVVIIPGYNLLDDYCVSAVASGPVVASRREDGSVLTNTHGSNVIPDVVNGTLVDGYTGYPNYPIANTPHSARPAIHLAAEDEPEFGPQRFFIVESAGVPSIMVWRLLGWIGADKISRADSGSQASKEVLNQYGELVPHPASPYGGDPVGGAIMFFWVPKQ